MSLKRGAIFDSRSRHESFPEMAVRLALIGFDLWLDRKSSTMRECVSGHRSVALTQGAFRHD
jgi:hypothetical protein